MRVLVTGGAGFIGSHLAAAYCAQGHEVAVLDNCSTGSARSIPGGVRFYRVDIRTYQDVFAAFQDFRPELISHHAAHVSVPRSFDKPEEDAAINIVGSINVVQAGLKLGVRRIVAASSAAVYGVPGRFPVSERTAARPQSPYGISKLAMEQYLQRLCEWRGIEWVVLRYANVYGPGQYAGGEAGVVASMASRLAAGQAVTIYGDGKQTRDYIAVEDVVRANLQATRQGKGVYVIGTGKEADVLTILAQLRQTIGISEREAVTQFMPGRSGDVRKWVYTIAKARRDLAWEPTVALADGLRATAQWYVQEGYANSRD